MKLPHAMICLMSLALMGNAVLMPQAMAMYQQPLAKTSDDEASADLAQSEEETQIPAFVARGATTRIPLSAMTQDPMTLDSDQRAGDMHSSALRMHMSGPTEGAEGILTGSRRVLAKIVYDPIDSELQTGEACALEEEVDELASSAESCPVVKIDKPFTFIRHGATNLSKEKTVSLNRDFPLNEEGHDQVKQAAELLKGHGIQVIVASPLQLTKETARDLAEVLGVPVVYHAGLKEIPWENLAGQTMGEAKVKIARWKEGENVEELGTIKAFHHRIATTLTEILSEYDNPLIVSHGLVYENLMALLGLKGDKCDNAVPYHFKPRK